MAVAVVCLIYSFLFYYGGVWVTLQWLRYDGVKGLPSIWALLAFKRRDKLKFPTSGNATPAAAVPAAAVAAATAATAAAA